MSVATIADPRVEALLRRRRERPGKCVFCGGKLNTFDGARCPHCRLDQPSAPDLEPVSLRAPDVPQHKEPEAVPTAQANGAPDRAPAQTHAKATGPCPTCGKPTHPANGRCYECRPGGFAGASAGAPRRGKGRPAKPAAAPSLDAEVAAIAAVLAALDGLDASQLRRVLAYVRERVQSPNGE
jgi:hypothetical protein